MHLRDRSTTTPFTTRRSLAPMGLWERTGRADLCDKSYMCSGKTSSVVAGFGEEQRQQTPLMAVPLVMTHPTTGRKSLYGPLGSPSMCPLVSQTSGKPMTVVSYSMAWVGSHVLLRLIRRDVLRIH